MQSANEVIDDIEQEYEPEEVPEAPHVEFENNGPVVIKPSKVNSGNSLDQSLQSALHDFSDHKVSDFDNAIFDSETVSIKIYFRSTIYYYKIFNFITIPLKL